jgi:hypothetical protein
MKTDTIFWMPRISCVCAQHVGNEWIDNGETTKSRNSMHLISAITVIPLRTASQ